jgi:hypothetical protein
MKIVMEWNGTEDDSKGCDENKAILYYYLNNLLKVLFKM